MRPILAVLPILALAACQTPQEACLAGGARELRIVDSLIRETQGNLRRGYAIEEEQEVQVDRDICEVEVEDGPDRLEICEDVDVDVVERPVAIDLEAEQRELDGLLERRAALAAERDARAQACLAAYPEG